MFAWRYGFAGLCGDKPPPGEYTCQDQKGFGKCDADFMLAGKHCDRTCGRCTGDAADSSRNRAAERQLAFLLVGCGADAGGRLCDRAVRGLCSARAIWLRGAFWSCRSHLTILLVVAVAVDGSKGAECSCLAAHRNNGSLESATRHSFVTMGTVTSRAGDVKVRRPVSCTPTLCPYRFAPVGKQHQRPATSRAPGLQSARLTVRMHSRACAWGFGGRRRGGQLGRDDSRPERGFRHRLWSSGVRTRFTPCRGRDRAAS